MNITTDCDYCRLPTNRKLKYSRFIRVKKGKDGDFEPEFGKIKELCYPCFCQAVQAELAVDRRPSNLKRIGV